MNKALLLLLVTLVQSRSYGILLPSPDNSDKFEENLEDFQLEDWDSSEAPYSYIINKDYNQNSQSKKRSTNDVLTRRSALDKNFMRFGRDSGENIPDKFFRDLRSGLTGSKQNFVRFGRGLKDNFIRFGRGSQENFIRFGRGGKDSFIRFGRGHPEDFFRSGKSVRENFIRFGKADKNFMRFGRETPDNDDKQANIDNQDYFSHLQKTTGNFDETSGGFERIGKSNRSPDNFIRFGKSGNQKEGRNGTNFLRFGKNDPTETNEIFEIEDSDSNSSSQDLNHDTLKYGPGIRIRRQTTGTHNLSEQNANKKLQHEKTSEKSKSNSGNIFMKTAANGGDESHENNESEKIKIFKRRSTGFFEDTLENFPRNIHPVLVDNHWKNLENLKNSRLTPPFFPVPLKIPKNALNPYFNFLSLGLESKRNQGGSNFIRFG